MSENFLMEQEPSKLTKLRIVQLALISELGLVALALVWAYTRGLSLSFRFSATDSLYGALLSLPLLCLNFLIFNSIAERWVIFQSVRDFRDSVVIPLTSVLDYRMALLVSCLAGIGEEIFFRGVLQQEIGILPANLLFAALHFGLAALSLPLLLSIYFIFGCYFSIITLHFNSLIPAIVAHAVYDFLAICYIKWKHASEQQGVSPNET